MNATPMIDHFGIPCSDIAAASAFYDAVLAPLGHTRVMDFGEAIGYGTGQPVFWISASTAATAGSESHIAFAAADEATVRAFHQAAVARGAETLHEPRLWPEYHERYFAVFVRDPDGNNVEAVCHTATPEGAAPGQPQQSHTEQSRTEPGESA